MFKEYLDGLREKFDSIEFKYNHETLYLTVLLHKGDKTIGCVIDHFDLSDEKKMIEEIEKQIQRNKV